MNTLLHLPLRSRGKTPICLLLVLGSILFSTAAEDPSPITSPGWPFALPRQSRPWAYHWWMGSAVDTNNLARQLRLFRQVGLGGVHIIPIYGAKGFEADYIQFLSPQWMQMLDFTIREAARLDLGVDMTTGTGWCFGGPVVPREQGGWRLQTRAVPVAADAWFEDRLPPATTLVGIVATLADGTLVNLATNLTPSRTIRWRPAGSTAQVSIVTATPAGPKVKRASPGGAGLMLNPFDRSAMTNYLDWFSRAFGAYSGALPRAMYHDSYEYNSSWVPNLLTLFQQRRGYALQDHLPALCADPRGDDLAARVRSDYKETLSDLLIDHAFPEWTAWSHQHGTITRNEAHGAPANLLDFYALADIPETEMFGRGGRDPLNSGFDSRFAEGDRDPLVCKFASSAAHIAGKPLVAAETGTWLAEHFCETLEEMKCLIDLLFVSGVNHVFYHGTCYSPDNAPWPGWLFYASTQMNPRNPIWHDAPVLNAYVSRCQSILQSGTSDNDIALYWPIHDLWHGNASLLVPCTVHKREWLEEQPVGAVARALWSAGYTFDYVSDRFLASATTQQGMVRFAGGSSFPIVLVPHARLMPATTFEKLLALAELGATIFFTDSLPQDVPGAGDLQAQRRRFKFLLDRVSLGSLSDGLQEATVGKGRILVGSLASGLKRARITREELTDHPGAVFVRRKDAAGAIYFIANQGTNTLAGWVGLAKADATLQVLDALTGQVGQSTGRSAPGGSYQHRLSLQPGHSIILRTVPNPAPDSPRWRWFTPGQVTLPITGPWQVEFTSGGPALPNPAQVQQLRSWTEFEHPEARRFAGTAVYRTTFDPPAGQKSGLLDLGRVCHSARVRLNGREVAGLIMKPYTVWLDSLKSSANILEIEVTNLAANRIRDLDRRKIPWRNFHDANVVNINYRPFNASNWPIFDSGLIGPVCLRTALEPDNR